MTGAKPWWLSKTIWIAVLQIVSGVLASILAQEWVASHPQAVGVLIAIVGIINAVLRSITTKPISLGT